MFTMECDGTVFYNDASISDLGHVLDPKLQLLDNASGNLTCILPKSNVAYDKVKKITSTIVVKREGVWLWEGRVLNDQIDFYGRKTLTCEGAMSYLNDTVLLPKKYTTSSMSNLLSQLLAVHNGKVPNSRKIYIGAVTVNPSDFPSSFQTNYENLMTFIKEQIVDIYGGHMRVRKDGSQLKLDYYKDPPKTSPQEIDFGVNLVDFTRTFDFSKVCTVIIPRGKQLSNSENDDGTPKYLTIDSVNGNSPYLANNNTLATYGRVEKVVEFNDVEDPNVLLRLGRAYLSNYQFENLVLSVSAVDLHVMNPSVKAFDLLDNVRCKSIPHGLDKYMPITQMDIPLDHPENLKYTLGTDQNLALSGAVSSISSGTKGDIDDLPTRSSVLEQAFANASEILAQTTTGFVNIVTERDYSEALIISDNKDWRKANRYWKFNMNGLGFYQNGKLKGIAITMDGQIVADYITTGTLNAAKVNVINLNANNITAGTISGDKIKGGTIEGVTIRGATLISKGKTSVYHYDAEFIIRDAYLQGLVYEKSQSNTITPTTYGYIHFNYIHRVDDIRAYRTMVLTSDCLVFASKKIAVCDYTLLPTGTNYGSTVAKVRTARSYAVMSFNPDGTLSQMNGQPKNFYFINGLLIE